MAAEAERVPEQRCADHQRQRLGMQRERHASAASAAAALRRPAELQGAPSISNAGGAAAAAAPTLGATADGALAVASTALPEAPIAALALEAAALGIVTLAALTARLLVSAVCWRRYRRKAHAARGRAPVARGLGASGCGGLSTDARGAAADLRDQPRAAHARQVSRRGSGQARRRRRQHDIAPTGRMRRRCVAACRRQVVRAKEERLQTARRDAAGAVRAQREAMQLKLE